MGDWEGDLIIGQKSKSAIGTLVDRASRYLRLVHLPGGHGAEDLRTALGAVLGELPDAARWTLTWDQGSEMAHHDLLAAHYRDGIFFARPGSPWLRGTNENTNGLLRQYFPKGSNLAAHDSERPAAPEDPRMEDPARGLPRSSGSINTDSVATITRIRQPTPDR